MKTQTFVLLALLAIACGGGSAGSRPSHGGSYGYQNNYASSGGYATGAVPTAASASEESAYDSYDSDDELAGELSAPDSAPMRAAPMPAPAPPMYAQASPGPGATVPGTPAQPQQPPTATDASPGGGPLLIYEANISMAVFKVTENIERVAGLAREAGGFISHEQNTFIVVRVPVGKFNEVIDKIEELGDMLNRDVRAQDVSEEFRDVEIRLRNAIQVRDRLAELLNRATKVEESLQIEHELERLVGEIERLKGRMRFLQDRIAFSTITVAFQPKEQERLQNDMFRLPFDWLNGLGLQRLLSL